MRGIVTPHREEVHKLGHSARHGKSAQKDGESDRRRLGRSRTAKALLGKTTASQQGS